MKNLTVLSVLFLLVSVMALSPSDAGAAAKKILIYKDSLAPSGFPVNEKSVALGMGFTVRTYNSSRWNTLTTADFQGYDAIIVPDGACDFGSSVFATLNATRKTWAPAVQGAIVLSNFDPAYHATQGNGPGGPKVKLLENILNYVTSGNGTGLYVGGIGCFYNDPTSINFLNPFGGVSISDNSGDNAHIVNAASPIVAGETDAALSAWDSSFHAGFTSFPDYFQTIVTGDAGINDAIIPVLIATPDRP